MTQKISPQFSQSRQQLEEIFETGQYQTLIDVYLGKFGEWLTHLPGIAHPPSYTYNAFLVNLLTLLIAVLISLAAQETEIANANLQIEVAGVSLIFLLLVILKKVINIIFAFINDHLINLLENTRDIDQFSEELEAFCNKSPAIYVGLSIFIFRGLFSGIYPILVPERGNLGFGPNFLTMITLTQLGIIIYYFIRLIILILTFGHFTYNIYSIDPGSTELIQNIKTITTKLIYLVTLIVVSASLLFWFVGIMNPLNAIVLTLAGWIPLTSLFISSFYVQRQIIINTKLVALREIQAKITTLQSKEEIPSAETLDHISKLIDYHDRIKKTSNSSMDIRSIFNFFNSLFLPVLTSGIANYQEISKLWQELIGK